MMGTLKRRDTSSPKTTGVHVSWNDGYLEEARHQLLDTTGVHVQWKDGDPQTILVSMCPGKLELSGHYWCPCVMERWRSPDNTGVHVSWKGGYLEEVRHQLPDTTGVHVSWKDGYLEEVRHQLWTLLVSMCHGKKGTLKRRDTSSPKTTGVHVSWKDGYLEEVRHQLPDTTGVHVSCKDGYLEEARHQLWTLLVSMCHGKMELHGNYWGPCVMERWSSMDTTGVHVSWKDGAPRTLLGSMCHGKMGTLKR
ncbi:hypothetical protein NDU88_013260 [Pleurodeles waltl]|uniref:Uncharacterized protein n=1 Tax=Pleurodeles waltl TaxID=8319 RepID=A0AAV7R480_PLEWA|nr:hypothetical protein NDU88_013260 [Pleurodeles waltl]